MREDIIFWLAATVILFAVEAATVNLVTVWFGIGALVAFIVAVAGGGIGLQIGLFVAMTAITLIFTRPLVKKHFNGKQVATNADMVIGKTAVVTENIDNLAAKGAVSCMGKIWSARTENGETLSEGEKVTVKAIQGVKLIVVPQETES